MDYQSKKSLFKYITGKKYKIRKHDECNNILFINFDTFKIKCKYFLLFNTISNELFWSWQNPYCSVDTKKIDYEIYKKFEPTINKINKINKLADSDEFRIELSNLIKSIIKNCKKVKLKNKIYDFLWILEDRNNNYSSFYGITEIIYF